MSESSAKKALTSLCICIVSTEPLLTKNLNFKNSIRYHECLIKFNDTPPPPPPPLTWVYMSESSAKKALTSLCICIVLTEPLLTKNLNLKKSIRYHECLIIFNDTPPPHLTWVYMSESSAKKALTSLCICIVSAEPLLTKILNLKKSIRYHECLIIFNNDTPPPPPPLNMGIHE